MAFTLIFLAVLVFDVYPGLRGGGGWRWPYALPDDWLPVLVLAVLLVVYLVGVVWLRRHYPAGQPIFALIAAAVLGVAVVGVRGDPVYLLLVRTLSPVQAGASLVAVEYMADEGLQPTLERWPSVMREAGERNIIHFTTSPPGQPLIHYSAAHIFDSSWPSTALRPYQCSNLQAMRYTRGELNSTVIGMLMPLWAALAVVPLSVAAFDLTGDRSMARRLATWWPLVPTVLLFAPTWNTLYPALCVTSFALLLRGFLHKKPDFVVAGGVVMSITTFLNFAVLPVLLLFGLFTLGAAGVSLVRPYVIWAVRQGVWFGIGLASVWIVYWLASGLTPLDLWNMTVNQHGDLVQREYLPWLILHPYDTLMFVGWPLAALFLLGVWWSIWKWNIADGKNAVPTSPNRRDAQQRIRRKAPSDQTVSEPLHAMERGPGGEVIALIFATLTTFILVNLSGIAQGENARIMSFYAPFFLLSGVTVLRHHTWDLPLLAAQALTVLVMAAVLPVIRLDLNPQPDGPRTDIAQLAWEPSPVNVRLTSEQYNGEALMGGYRFVADIVGQGITLETIWQGVVRPERPYQFEVVARAENDMDGEIVSEPHRWYAQNGNYLPTCWRAGDVVHDVTFVPLPLVSAPVQWTLTLQLVDERTGDTFGPPVELGPVPYP